MCDPDDPEDLSFPCDSAIPEAIPDGDYEVSFRRAETINMWKQDKLFLWFVMVTPGPWLRKEFFMACTIANRHRWGPSHKYWLAWTLAAGTRPNRPARMSTKVFRKKIFRARFRTVRRTAQQMIRTKSQQYSVIDQLIEVVAGERGVQ